MSALVKWEPFVGLDYACVMLPGETTDTASIEVHTDCPDERDRLLSLISDAPKMIAAIKIAEQFMSGFEDDTSQVGIPGHLAFMRALLARVEPGA